VWLHDDQGDRMATSEAAAALADPRNGSAFSPDGRKLYYLLRRPAGAEVNTSFSVGELWELDLQSGATQAAMPGFSITDFSFSPDGREVAFSALSEKEMATSAGDLTQSIWLAPLDRSFSPRLLQTNANRARFAPGFIYYVKRKPAGSYLHRIRLDGSGDEQIWPENIVSGATSPDGRYLAVTVPIKERMWKLEIVDWALRRVQPVCNDAIAYWSDDGKAFVVSGGFGSRNPSGPTYVVDLPVADSVPKLPASGLSSFEQFANVKNVRIVPGAGISVARGRDTYAYVKETVQRNLYRIPLR
jgi:dipeptidyl aminopeptidase/acylaminoacyl peptidase